MSYFQYLVSAPERWDNVAYKAYGNPGMIEGIVSANPDVQITSIIPAGTILNIPVVSSDEQATAADDLPPWA